MTPKTTSLPFSWIISAGLQTPGISNPAQVSLPEPCAVSPCAASRCSQEPTSGLDSALALRVVRTLERFAREADRSVVTTIHQPSSQVSHTFHNVMLLTDGQVGQGRELVCEVVCECAVLWGVGVWLSM